MSKKAYYLIIDTETTMNDKVADFGAVVCDRQGTIVSQCAVLVRGVFGIDPLFYIAGEKTVYGQLREKINDMMPIMI